jgi:hypothetical protein
MASSWFVGMAVAGGLLFVGKHSNRISEIYSWFIAQYHALTVFDTSNLNPGEQR